MKNQWRAGRGDIWLGFFLITCVAAGAYAASPALSSENLNKAGAVAQILGEFRRAGPALELEAGEIIAAQTGPTVQIHVDSETGLRWSFSSYTMTWASSLVFCQTRSARRPSIAEAGTVRMNNLVPIPSSDFSAWTYEQSERNGHAVTYYFTISNGQTDWAYITANNPLYRAACLHPNPASMLSDSQAP